MFWLRGTDVRRLGRAIGRGIIFLFLLFTVLWLAVPGEPVDREISFDASLLPEDLEAWLQAREQQYPDILPGTAKQIVWAGNRGEKTPVAVVYMHGFSATSHEIRPVPERVASALGANLYYARLAGHGRGGAAMAEPAAGDWIEDMAEAMAIGRRLGDRVIVIGTSTGGTLAAIAATDPDLSRDLAGVIFISPNFRLRPVAARLLDLPLVRYWGPLIAGAEVGFTPVSDEQARFWTTRYPTVALVPMAALARHARGLDFGAARVPALFLSCENDKVIDPEAISSVAADWGGPVRVESRDLGPDDDPYAHILAGDILSPNHTAGVVALILDWAKDV